MAKYTKVVMGNFDAILATLHNTLKSSYYVDGSDYNDGVFRFSVRVYERYSYVSHSRISMSLTLAGTNGRYLLTAITSGQGDGLVKIHTASEKAFLNMISGVIDRL